MLKIIQIPVLTDNYVYLIHDEQSGNTAVVDPAEADPVIKALNEHQWNLTHILNTHHHWDHVGANLQLKEKFSCRIYGCKADAARIPGIDISLEEGDQVHLGSESAIVLFTPGHTSGHICYHFPDSKALMCGDTLFSMGCGRLFEGTPEQMITSMKKIRQLPPDTFIYCAHEYTESNGKFALSIEPNNSDLQNRMAQVRSLRERGMPTVPSSLEVEVKTNPFLRWDVAEIKANLGMENEVDWRIFSEIRTRKDHF